MKEIKWDYHSKSKNGIVNVENLDIAYLMMFKQDFQTDYPPAYFGEHTESLYHTVSFKWLS